jgi:hypothetical protein
MIKKIKDKNIKWWIEVSSCTILFLLIMIFGYSKINFLIKGVEIKATVVRDEHSSLVKVEGNAKNSVLLVLNGREIFIDKEGNFSESIGLLPGFSVISIEAEDKFGKNKKEKFSLVTTDNVESIAFNKQQEEIIN